MDYEIYEQERAVLLEKQGVQLEDFDNKYMSKAYPLQSYMVEGIVYNLVGYTHQNGKPCATFERKEIITHTLTLEEIMLLESRKKFEPL